MSDYDISSGITSYGVNLEWESMVVFLGGEINSTIVNESGFLFVSSGGIAKNTTVNSGGNMYVLLGGAAKDLTINSSASLFVSSGGIATNIIENGGYVDVADGAEVSFVPNTISNLTLYNGSATVHSGTTVNSTTINKGFLKVYSGGTANFTNLFDGSLFVSSGGIATNIIENGGYVDVADGAEVSFADNSFSNLLIRGRSATIHSGTFANSITVGSSGYLWIYSSGIVNSVTAEDYSHIYNYGGFINDAILGLYANMDVASNGTLNNVEVTGTLNVLSGGIANNTIVNHGKTYVLLDGIIEDITVNADGSLFVSSGGIATNIIENGGYVDVADGAEVSFVPNTISNLTLYNGSATVHSGTTANSTTISKGFLTVCSGGLANGTIAKGDLYVSLGGVASETTVYANGVLSVSSGGTASDTTIKGVLIVNEGGLATNNTVKGHMTVCSGGYAKNTNVKTGGLLEVSSGGINDSGYVDGEMIVSSGGTVNEITVCGSLGVSSGGTALNVIEDGGYVCVMDGAHVTFASNTLNRLHIGGTTATVHSGTTAISTTIAHGAMDVIGGKASYTALEGGVLTLLGGKAFYTSNTKGNIIISSGGTANSTTVNTKGSINVYSDGRANYTTINSSGYLYIHSGGYTNNTTNNGGDIKVLALGFASNTTIASGGSLTISSGGTAIRTSVDSGCYLTISAGGTALEIVENGGWISIQEGAEVSFVANEFSGLIVDASQKFVIHSGTTATDNRIIKGSFIVSSGATANNTAVFASCMLYASNGATVNNTTINSSGRFFVCPGGDADGAIISSGGMAYISSYGTGNNFIVESKGNLYISSGGIINDIRAEFAGNVIVSSNGTATNIIENGGYVDVAEGAEVVFTPNTINNLSLCNISATLHLGTIASNTTLTGSAQLDVFSGGTANTIIANGYMEIPDGNNVTYIYPPKQTINIYSCGSANDIDLHGGLLVSSCGVVNQINVNAFASLYVFSGGIATNVKENGGYVKVSDGAEVSFVPNIISKRIVSATSFFNSAAMTVHSGTTAISTTIATSCQMEVFSGGTADVVNLNSKTGFCVYSGGTATGIIMSSVVQFSFDVSPDTYIQGVSNGSSFEITSGILSGYGLKSGTIRVFSGGLVNRCTISSGFGNALTVFSGGIANDITVQSGGCFTIEYGEANSVTMGPNASMHINSGLVKNITMNGGGLTVNNATISNTTVYYADRIQIGAGGIANTTEIRNCSMFVSSGGIANNTTVYGYLNILSGGTASNTVISGYQYSGTLDVSYHAIAYDTKVNSDGHLLVRSGGMASNTTINSGGFFTINDEAIATDVVVNSMGCLRINAGGKITGKIIFEDNSIISAATGAILDFNVSELIPDNSVRVNNFSLINGVLAYTLTVSNAQSNGIYKLANYATKFNNTLTVQDVLGSRLGTISVGESLVIENTTYDLMLDNDTLLLKVSGNALDSIAPIITNVEADISTLTNQNVTVTAKFTDDMAVASRLYKLGINGTWTTYPDAGVIVEENTNVYFKAIDTSGNESEVVSYEVTNIDKIPPAKPTASADVTEATSGSVKVSAVFSGDSVKQEYSLDHGNTWWDYTAPVEFTTNGTVFFRGSDAAGNESEVSVYSVTNIESVVPDTTKPTVSSIEASTNAPTNQDVVVTAVFADDVAVASSLYKIDDGTWQDYMGSVIVTENATVYFKAVDTSKNESEVVSYAVTNIDKVAPLKPTATADVTTETSGDVIVTATFSNDSIRNEYSTDGINWAPYPGEIKFDDNGTVYFRSTDAAGNISEIASYTVSNITKDTDFTCSGLVVYSRQLVKVLSEEKYLNTMIYQGGSMYVSSGGIVNNTTLSGGQLIVPGGAEANYTEINSGGRLVFDNSYVVNAGYERGSGSHTTVNDSGCFDNSGWAVGVTVNSGGTMNVHSGGYITGQMLFAEGAVVSVDEKASVYFDITEREPSSEALVKNLSVIQGNPNYSLLVSLHQKSGLYTIADGVGASFDKTISVLYLQIYNTNDGGTVSVLDLGGTLSVGDSIKINNIDYTLNLADSSLILTVQGEDSIAPTVSNIQANTTDLTNQNVVITALFTDNVELAAQQYKIGDGTWTDYVDGVSVSENGTVYFKAVDTSGNESEIVSYDVTNIDKVKPTITGIVPSTTEPTDSVTITATFADDVALSSQQFKIGDGVWKDYMTGVTVTENTTVYFKAVDTAGNETTDSFDVTNIETPVHDTTKPTVSGIEASTYAPTNQDVVVTAIFADDVELASALYKIGENGIWNTYMDGVTVTENANVFFKAVDAAGNESDVVSYEVSNIDKEPPAKPTASADSTTPTNQNVTVTASFSNDSVKREYSTDGQNWLDYTTSITFVQNGTVLFRGTDAAGNVSEIASYTVNNIENGMLAKPVAQANITVPTNQTVTVTAVFDHSSAKNEYSLNGLVWLSYADGVDMLENGIVYFRSSDKSGNVSDVVSYTVSNIDKVSPDKPLVYASNTKLTNQDVSVTAIYSEDSTVKEYSMDGQNWIPYTGAITVSGNGLLFFRAKDEAGNNSGIVNFEVSNIDKEPPAKPVAFADVTSVTNQNVTVTASFSEDSVAWEYCFEEQTWKPYTEPIVFNANGFVFFRSTDEAGNISEITTFEVGNIDKEAPAVPVASADVTTSTTGDVLVSAVFSEDSVTKEYSLDGENWKEYTDAVKFTENGSVFFRGADAAGNVSEVATYTVSNIIVPENKPDNSENDYLWTKNNGWNDENITVTNTITGNGELNLDASGTVDKDGKHNMFGNDGTNKDSGDVAKIDVETSAKLTFTIDSTAAGTFYVYQDGVDKKGQRTQITVGKVTVKAGQTATLKDVCLTGDGKYYVAMVAKNVKKAGTEGLYNVSVTSSTFFVDADNGWNNTAAKGSSVEVGRGTTAIALDDNEMTESTEFANFVGFSDPVDYAKLGLASSAYLSFDLKANGAAKFTIWKQDAKGKLSKAGGVTSLTAKNGYKATTKAQFLDTSKYTYYVSMESSDAVKGGNAYYNVSLNGKTLFFDSADTGANNVLYDKKAKAFKSDANFVTTELIAGSQDVQLDSNAIGNEAFGNFVGYQDSVDYAKIVLTQRGSLSFRISALADVTFEIWQKGVDKKGKAVLTSLQKKTSVTVKDYTVGASATTAALTLDAGEYYISVTAKNTKANEKGGAFYNVTATFNASGSAASSLAMPETFDSLAITDSLSFGQYDADALEDASASSLAELDDKTRWQSLTLA